MDTIYFGVVDAIMLGGVLLLSMCVGVYCAYKDRNKKSTENYYFGNRKMSPIPLGFSMAVSFISAITMLGTPVEVYLFGIVIAWVCAGNVIATAFACVYYIPLIYNLKLTSIYEYLEMRFSRTVRISCSSITLLMMVFYMGFGIYIPSLALSAVTPLGIEWTIAITSIICTLYTTLGGFKAVVWTDVLQSIIMIIGSLALVIKGTIMVGGTAQVWEAAQRGGRINLFKITADPTVRSSMLAIFFGQVFMQAAGTCSNQAMAQRLLSCSSIRNARKALLFFLLPASTIFLLVVGSGCVLYAFFEGCDPLLSGKITKADQSIPYMMMRVFADTPGMAGIFVAAACSGTLSTVSTGINSLSVIILHDYILPFRETLTPRQKLFVGKACGIIIGCLITLIAYITGYLGTTTIQVATSTLGSFGGPIFGVFLLGMFFPKTNSNGALVGLALGAGLNLWISIGAVIYGLAPEKQQKLPVSTEYCEVMTTNYTSNSTAHPMLTGTTTGFVASEDERPLIADTLYSISFFYFGAIGTISTIIFGSIGSLLTGGNDVTKVNPAYFVPLLDNKCFSDSVRTFFRFGVPEPPSRVKSRATSEMNENSRDSFKLLHVTNPDTV